MKTHLYFEKVNPMHPDKVADRIGGAIVDLAYQKKGDKAITAVEVLIGHGQCNIIVEGNCHFTKDEILPIVERISKEKIKKLNLKVVKQDRLLAKNQNRVIKCGDNGIFKGVVPNQIEQSFTNLMAMIYQRFPTDGKGLIHCIKDDTERFFSSIDITICQSQAEEKDIQEIINEWKTKLELVLTNTFTVFNILINPLGKWEGGTYADCGLTGRKIGSDLGRAITGGSIQAKDLSKADVTLNIFAYECAKKSNKDVELCCSIGSNKILIDGDTYSYQYLTDEVKKYINKLGGFEKLAEWGLIRPIDI